MTEKHHQPVPLFRNASALSRALSTIAILLLGIFPLSAADLRLNEQDYFEAQGLSILLFHNAYHGVFGDEKMSGVEIILRGERMATNGDVRLSPTPERWDPIPQFKHRSPSGNQLTASLSYPDRGLSHHIEVPEPDGFRVTVHLDQIIQPDFPELKDVWPFLWYENEYVVDTVASYILAANAANAVAK